MSGVAYPGRGDVEPNGFTIRPADGCQVVTTKYPHRENVLVWTTAIYPRDAGRVVALNPVVSHFEFEGQHWPSPLWVAWTNDVFEAGRNHERACHMELRPPKKGENVWTKLLQDMLEIP